MQSTPTRSLAALASLALLAAQVQWHFHPRAFLKANVGWGLTTNATDVAPEVGILFSP